MRSEKRPDMVRGTRQYTLHYGKDDAVLVTRCGMTGTLWCHRCNTSSKKPCAHTLEVIGQLHGAKTKGGAP